MAAKTTTTAVQEAATTPTAPRIVKCRVAVETLELPHGIAAWGKIVHIPEDVYQLHADAGKVKFIDFVRN